MGAKTGSRRKEGEEGEKKRTNQTDYPEAKVFGNLFALTVSHLDLLTASFFFSFA